MNQPFQLPNADVRVLLGETEVILDAVEVMHKVMLYAEELGEDATKPAKLIPLFQKNLREELGIDVTYSDAYHVYRLCEEKFAETKKKFADELKLPPTSPASMPLS